jgi:hypothetical protein
MYHPDAERVVLHEVLDQVQKMMTDDTGKFLFQRVPTLSGATPNVHDSTRHCELLCEEHHVRPVQRADVPLMP